MKLSMLKLTYGRLPPEFLQIFPTVNWGTRAPQIFKKVDGVQSGEHFQGPPSYQIQNSFEKYVRE